MASIPLVALAGQQPKITDYQTMQANAAGIQNMRGQNALQPGQLVQQQQQIEQQRRALADQDAMTKAMQDWDGSDWMTLPTLVMKHGGSAQAVMSLKSALINQQKDLTGLNEAQLTLADMKADHWIQALNDVASAPEEQRPVLLEQAKANAIQKGWATPQEAQAVNYQNPQQFSALIKMAQGHKNAIAEVKSQAETNKATSEAGLAAAQTPGAEAKSSIEQFQAGMLKGGNTTPQAFYSAIDQVAPPTGPTAALNARTRAAVDLKLKTGDLEGARKAIDAASAEIGGIEKETSPAVIAAKKQEGVNTAQTGQDITQSYRPVLAYDRNNRTHLLSQNDARAAGYTGITQASDKEIDDAKTHNTTLNDMQPKLNDVVSARRALDQGPDQRAIISRALTHMEPGMFNDWISSSAMKGATQLTRDYVIAVNSLKESALGLPKEITNTARQSELQGNALFSTLPSGASVDSKYALQQAKKFQANIDRMRQRVPEIRGMSVEAPHPDLLAGTAPAKQKPAAATHTGVGSVDKKKHWLDAQGKDLGLAE